MNNATMKLEEFACMTCITKVKKGIKKQRGVEAVTVLIDQGQVNVKYNEEIINLQQIKNGIQKLKFTAFD